MKNLTILLSLIISVSMLNGCQTSGTPTVSTSPSTNKAPTSTPANKPPSTPANSAPPATSPNASGLKPEDVGPDKPVPAVDLKNAFFANQAAWKGKTVTITGNYHSTTTSTVSSGKIIRVDIADSTGKKVAGCTVTAEPTQEEIKERNNRTFRGTVKEDFFDQVLLEPCEMTK